MQKLKPGLVASITISGLERRRIILVLALHKFVTYLLT